MIIANIITKQKKKIHNRTNLNKVVKKQMKLQKTQKTNTI